MDFLFAVCAAGLSTCHFAWAFHSEAEEELLNMIPAMQRGDAQWSDLRAVGVGWWIRNINTLRKMVDKVPEKCGRAAASVSQLSDSERFMQNFIIFGFFPMYNHGKIKPPPPSVLDQDIINLIWSLSGSNVMSL